MGKPPSRQKIARSQRPMETAGDLGGVNVQPACRLWSQLRSEAVCLLSRCRVEGIAHGQQHLTGVHLGLVGRPGMSSYESGALAHPVDGMEDSESSPTNLEVRLQQRVRLGFPPEEFPGHDRRFETPPLSTKEPGQFGIEVIDQTFITPNQSGGQK
jgi:hypothetical protein